MPLLIDRTVPRPGLRLSILGFGGTTLGGRHVYADVDEAQAAATVGEAWARGVRYFDTAPFYGTGASEVRLGRALRRFARGEYVLSTKVGRRLEPLPPGEVNREGAPFRRVFDYSYDGTLRALEDSLERLQRDRIDIVYIHDVGNADHFHDAMDGAYRALERLRREGAIDAIGAGVSQWEICRDFAHAGDFDLLMLACRYTLVEHQLALHELLPLCLEKRIGVAVAAPFNSGILAASPPGPDARFNYGRAGPWVRNRVSRLGAACARHGVPLVAAALQFPLGHPAVVTVVAGSRNPTEVAANVEGLSVPISVAFWAELRADGLIDPDAPVPVAGFAGGPSKAETL
jgi:D-threo-aldose 1-dehydrogenase